MRVEPARPRVAADDVGGAADRRGGLIRARRRQPSDRNARRLRQPGRERSRRSACRRRCRLRRQIDGVTESDRRGVVQRASASDRPRDRLSRSRSGCRRARCRPPSGRRAASPRRPTGAIAASWTGSASIPVARSTSRISRARIGVRVTWAATVFPVVDADLGAWGSRVTRTRSAASAAAARTATRTRAGDNRRRRCRRRLGTGFRGPLRLCTMPDRMDQQCVDPH